MFYIIETQQQADGSATTLTYQESTRNGALSKWHGVLMYAAVSSVYIHSCAVLDEELNVVVHESFRHVPEHPAEVVEEGISDVYEEQES